MLRNPEKANPENTDGNTSVVCTPVVPFPAKHPVPFRSKRAVGREFTIGVIMHKGSLCALPPSEVILERNASFDYNGKYLGVGNKEVTPAEISPRQTALVQHVALQAHMALGCYGYTRTELFLTNRGIFFLETNTLPGITRASFIPQQLEATGIHFEEFVKNQLELALLRYE